jgi:hypothetical protein
MGEKAVEFKIGDREEAGSQLCFKAFGEGLDPPHLEPNAGRGRRPATDEDLSPLPRDQAQKGQGPTKPLGHDFLPCARARRDADADFIHGFRREGARLAANRVEKSEGHGKMILYAA